MKPRVEFHFDPVSPYAWLAARQIDRVEAAGATVEFRPVLFAGLLAAHGNKGPAELSAKRTYTFRDVLRTAARLGCRCRGRRRTRSIHCARCACASRSTTPARAAASGWR